MYHNWTPVLTKTDSNVLSSMEIILLFTFPYRRNLRQKQLYYFYTFSQQNSAQEFLKLHYSYLDNDNLNRNMIRQSDWSPKELR